MEAGHEQRISIWAPFVYPWVISLGTQFSRMGFNSCLYTPGAIGNYPSATKSIRSALLTRKAENCPRFEIIQIPATMIMGETLPHPKFLFRLLRDKADLTLVLGTETLGSQLVMFVARLLANPFIPIAEQNLDQRPKLSLRIRILSTMKKTTASLFHRNATVLLAESKMTKDYLLKTMHCLEERIVVSPHGVDDQLYKQIEPDYDFASQIGIPRIDLERTVVLYAGGFYSIKGIEYLAEAIVQDKSQNVTYLIVKYGDSTYLPLFKDAGNLKFLPLIPPWNMARLYSLVDIVVIPSVTEMVAEISPNVLLEAMACGKAVVATNIGGIPDIMGNDGILIPERDSKAIAKAVRELVENPMLRDELGERARKRIVEQFSISEYAMRIIELLSQHSKVQNAKK